MANTRKFKFSVDPLKVSGVHVNMPVLATRANFPDEFFDPASANRSAGNDLRVFDKDGTTEAARELVGGFSLDSGTAAGDGAIEAWMKWPLLDAADPTPYLWLEYGDRTLPDYAVGDAYGRNAVWADYKGVWHLNDTSWTDSSGNGNDLTLVGTGSIVNTLNGKGVLLGASSDLRATNTANLTGLATIQASVWLTPNNSAGGILGAINGESGSAYSFLQVDVAGTEWSTNSPVMWSKVRVGSGATQRSAPAVTGFVQGDPLLCRYSYDGTNEKIAFNSYEASFAKSGALWSNTEYGIIIGRIHHAASGVQAPLKEARVSSVVFSADYNITTYQNQSAPAAFASPGAPVAIGGGSAFSASFLASSEQSVQIMASAGAAVERIAAIQRAEVLAAETSAGLSGQAVISLEHALSFSLSQYLASEIASDLRATNMAAVERGQQIQAESLIPVAWSGAVQFIFSAAGSIEITAAFAGSAGAAMESSLQVGAERLIAVEASATIAATELLATEKSADFTKGATPSTEHMAVVLAAQVISPEHVADYFNGLGPQVETLAVVQASSLIPVTWDGVSGFISGISQIFKRGPAGRGTRFAGRGRIAIFPNNRKRN